MHANAEGYCGGRCRNTQVTYVATASGMASERVHGRASLSYPTLLCWANTP